ncbi:MAG: hypothetical protein AAF125_06725, partial [Chloroflexota bacterium]
VGVDNIRTKSVRQTELIVELADVAGYEVVSPRDTATRAGTITVNPPHAYAVSRELLARDILIDYRAGAGIRVAPHFYNTDDEVRAVIETIGMVLDDGSWEQHGKSRDFVT